MKRSVPESNKVVTVTAPPVSVGVDTSPIADAISKLMATRPAESNPPRKLEVTVTERDNRGGIRKLMIEEV